ncbi:metal ABC transporter ATP-binding protein [Fusibacter bizertensis]
MIKFENVDFSYGNGTGRILQNINFEINEGDYITVIGENGSGKTTLMKLLLNFLSPTSGTITRDIKRLGYVPQKSDFANTSFPITVFEALYSYGKLLKIKDKDLTLQKLEQVGMLDYKDALMGTLSGGQAQKILIARALLGNPDLLVLDEPTTGVDVAGQKDIYAFLKKINAEEKITIVSVEHNIETIISNSTQIYHVKDKRGHLCSTQKYADEYLKKFRRED